MVSVSQLGYIGIGASDVKAWQDLATHVLGMQVIPGDDRSTSYLRMDEYHHRVELRPTGSDDLEFAGWEVPDQATLHRVAQQLEDGGVKVTAGTRDEADGPTGDRPDPVRRSERREHGDLLRPPDQPEAVSCGPAHFGIQDRRNGPRAHGAFYSEPG
jgi:hypothetical protein